jgi:hypothetical protein
MAILPDAPLTEEQYLEIERLAEFRSEFHDGRMFAMAPQFDQSCAALRSHRRAALSPSTRGVSLF